MAIRNIEGHLTGENKTFAVVLSRFNSFMTERLLEGAVDCLLRHGAREEDITAIRVPGAWEIPIAAKRAAESTHYEAVICLGAVVRGETPHFDYVAAEVSKGLASLSLQTDKPVSFGVLTTDTAEQAIDRSGSKAGNKGWDAALSALEMVDVLGKVE